MRAAVQPHDPEKIRQYARELRGEADMLMGKAQLVKGAAWVGTAATMGMLGRFFFNRVMPMPFEMDMNRRQAVLYGMGGMIAGCLVQGKLPRSLQVRSRHMEEESRRVALLAEDAEQELRDADWWPADHVDAEAPNKQA